MSVSAVIFVAVVYCILSFCQFYLWQLSIMSVSAVSVECFLSFAFVLAVYYIRFSSLHITSDVALDYLPTVCILSVCTYIFVLCCP
jgi:hypothetical protein